MGKIGAAKENKYGCLLRSTKENANLIWPVVFDSWCPVHGYRQENPHSCKVAKMCPPLEFYRGVSRSGSWYDTIAGNIFWHEACARS